MPNELKIHPAAMWLPELGGSEFQELKQDIASRGLREPILTKSGFIVDGRHRYKACEQLGIEPRFQEFEGTDIIAEIASRNLFRRNLTPRERADLVVKMCGDTLAKEAHDRQTAHLKRGEEFPVAPISAERERGETAERIAKLARVGRNVAREALRAHKDGAGRKRKTRAKVEVGDKTDEKFVMKRLQKWLDFWPVTQHRAVRKICRRFFCE
jgi:hypothetical protein